MKIGIFDVLPLILFVIFLVTFPCAEPLVYDLCDRIFIKLILKRMQSCNSEEQVVSILKKLDIRHLYVLCNHFNIDLKDFAVFTINGEFHEVEKNENT